MNQTFARQALPCCTTLARQRFKRRALVAPSKIHELQRSSGASKGHQAQNHIQAKTTMKLFNSGKCPSLAELHPSNLVNTIFYQVF